MARLTALRNLNPRAPQTNLDSVVTGDIRTTATAVAIVRVSAAAAGRTLGNFVLPLVMRGRLPRAGPGSAQSMADAVATAASVVHQFVTQHLRTATTPWAEWPTHRTKLLQRELDMLELCRRESLVLIQAGLFDRRALRLAETERDSRDEREEDAHQRVAALSSDCFDLQTDILAIHAGVWPPR